MDIEKQKTTIKTLYIFLIISTIFSFVPMAIPQILSITLILTVLIIAYFYKFKGNDDGILSNHMVYMIGTIWISGTFLALGMLAAAGLVFSYGDHTIIHNAMEQITSGTMMDEGDMMSTMANYMVENKTILILSSVPTIGPAILYFVYRITNGYGRAVKGYRIAKPNSWL